MQKNNKLEEELKESMLDIFSEDIFSCKEERILRQAIEGKSNDDILKELGLPTRYNLF